MRVANNKKNQSFYIDWDFFDEIPIMEIVDFLEIKLTNGNRFCCPAHNDTNPSASINLNENYWHCFSCGCGGNGLSLVAYTMGFLKKNHKADYTEAALYLDKNGFSGGITYYSSEPKKEEPEFPIIPRNFFTIIGLKQNPFRQTILKNSGINIPYQLDEVEASRMVIFKIDEYIYNQELYKQNILKQFPKLSYEGIQYMYSVIDNDINKMKIYKEEFLEYGKYFYQKQKENKKMQEEENNYDITK